MTNMTITVVGQRSQPTTNGVAGGRPRISVGHSLPPDRGPRQPKAAERVARDIVHDIVARGLRTGDHLPLEAQMVDEYCASRASVREALRLLEVQGLLHLKPGPGGGPVVGQVDPANLARTTSLYFHLGGATYDAALRTQLLLEPVCADAAARHPLRHATMERYLTPASSRSDDDYRAHAEGFHAAIYRLAGNPIIALLTQAITRIVSEQLAATMDPVELRASVVHEHAALAKAIAGGRSDVAARFMVDHLRAQHEHFRRHAPDKIDDLIEWR
jgi:DNA-binding FadR family transcriptional regulator